MALQTAVVGAGTVSGVHLRGLEKNPRTDLVAICDLDEDAARRVASEYHISAYADVSKLLENEDLDWLHVCTPPSTHLDISVQAMEAGVPVLIEKPVVETMAEFEELEAAAERTGVPCSVVHNHVFSPVMRAAVERIERGDLGDVRSVDLVYTNMTKPDEPNRGSWNFDLAGGEFEEGLPHPLYTTLRVGGFPRDNEAINAQPTLFREYDQDFSYDGVQVQYATDTGALCSAKILSGTIPQRYVVVHGEDQSLTADFISQTLLVHDRDYQDGAVEKARNNLDRAVDRVAGTVKNVRDVAEREFRGGFDREMEMNSHYYQMDATAKALENGSPMPVPLEQAKWTVAITEVVRDEAANNAANADADDADNQALAADDDALVAEPED